MSLFAFPEVARTTAVPLAFDVMVAPSAVSVRVMYSSPDTISHVMSAPEAV